MADEYQAFQSTRPSRASTADDIIKRVQKDISIHKALAGLDFHVLSGLEHQTHFNPQGPRGPRLVTRPYKFCFWIISIHKALAGLDSR